MVFFMCCRGALELSYIYHLGLGRCLQVLYINAFKATSKLGTTGKLPERKVLLIVKIIGLCVCVFQDSLYIPE